MDVWKCKWVPIAERRDAPRELHLQAPRTRTLWRSAHGGASRGACTACDEIATRCGDGAPGAPCHDVIRFSDSHSGCRQTVFRDFCVKPCVGIRLTLFYLCVEHDSHESHFMCSGVFYDSRKSTLSSWDRSKLTVIAIYSRSHSSQSVLSKRDPSVRLYTEVAESPDESRASHEAVYLGV